MDRLIQDKGELKMTDEEKAAEMRGMIYELKMDIPQTFQEAWNHPDPVIQENGKGYRERVSLYECETNMEKNKTE